MFLSRGVEVSWGRGGLNYLEAFRPPPPLVGVEWRKKGLEEERVGRRRGRSWQAGEGGRGTTVATEEKKKEF